MIHFSAFEILGIACVISLLDTVSQICFKKAVDEAKVQADSFKNMLLLTWRLLSQLRSWVGMWCGLLGLFLWGIVLFQADVNFIFSLSAVHFIFIAIGAKLFLRESFDRKKWIATILIALGIFIISFDADHQPHSSDNISSAEN